MEDIGQDDIARARQEGAAAADSAISQAPDNLILRIAWAAGFGEQDRVQQAVDDARQAGFTWRQIAEATGGGWRGVQTKYGGGKIRQARYRARKRGEDQ